MTIDKKRLRNVSVCTAVACIVAVTHLTGSPAYAGTGFGPVEDWTTDPVYGEFGTFLADVTGDKRADAIAVSDRVYVRRSTGASFLPKETWTSDGFKGGWTVCLDYCYRMGGTFFADVTGDGRADAIAVSEDRVYVRRSNGQGFDPAEAWTSDPYFANSLDCQRAWGEVYCSQLGGEYFTDVTGDGRADAIVVANNKVHVRRSNGGSFESAAVWTDGTPRHFADVTGDGRADAVRATSACDWFECHTRLWVGRSNGSRFEASVAWMAEGHYFDDRALPMAKFADVTGDGRADALEQEGTNDFSGWRGWVMVARSNGSDVAPAEEWALGNLSYYRTSFADVTGDGRADAVSLGEDRVRVQRANGELTNVWIGGPSEVDPGATYTLTAYAVGDGPFTYRWNTGETTRSITKVAGPTASGSQTWTVEVTDARGYKSLVKSKTVYWPVPGSGDGDLPDDPPDCDGCYMP